MKPLLEAVASTQGNGSLLLAPVDVIATGVWGRRLGPRRGHPGLGE